jgi:glutathione reductase (NADPH)
VLGSGYIAVEFAGIFAALGAHVDLVYRAPLPLRGFDQDMREATAEALTAQGITLHPGCTPRSLELDGDTKILTLSNGTGLTTELVFSALGRAPATARLGLDKAGVATTPTGAVIVDAHLRTSQPHIYAIGDVTDRLNLTPVAIAEGRALAETLFNDNPIAVDHTNVATAVFSQPPVGTVGLSERRARERHEAVDIYRARFRPMKHTLSGREERTMMKLVVDRASDRVLGCHMVGADAPEIIQGIAIAIKCGATKRQFDQTIGIHPTAAEEFVTMRDKVPEKIAAE